MHFPLQRRLNKNSLVFNTDSQKQKSTFQNILDTKNYFSMKIGRNLLIGILAGVLTSIALVASYDSNQAIAQMGGMMGGSDGGGMHGGMMGGQGPQHFPGTVHQMCHKPGSMPPHYCEPVYKTMSSVKGVKISNVDMQNDNSVKATLKQIGTASGAVSQKIVVVGGSGHLAGASIVEGGWSGTTTVIIPFEGLGTLYDHGSMHLHIFPITSG